MLAAGVGGFFLKELGISPGPIILGLILGPIAEVNFRGALEISGGKLSIFVTKPISLFISGPDTVSAGLPLCQGLVSEPEKT